MFKSDPLNLNRAIFLATIFASVAVPSAAFALVVEQDQGVLKIQYAKIAKDFEYELSPGKGCASDSAKVLVVGKKLTVRHSGSCSSGATLSLTLKKGEALEASLVAGSAQLLNFDTYKNDVGTVLIDVKVGTAAVASQKDFKKVREYVVGRAYERAGSGSGAPVSLRVMTGRASVD